MGKDHFSLSICWQKEVVDKFGLSQSRRSSTFSNNMSRTRWYVGQAKMAVVLAGYGFNYHLVIMVSYFKGG